MRKIISVTEAARNFADCINRAHYQNVTFVLLKSGSPVARIVPDSEKVCTGKDLVSALVFAKLPAGEAQEWARDLRSARRGLKPLSDKWR
jgi:antitoxin (DNA-binding transcriptional repressor) of toxin-antitoxin stability system